MTSSLQSPVLSEQDRADFLRDGYVRIEGAVPPAHLAQWQDLAWERVGFERDDLTTWAKPRVHLPPTRAVRLDEFAPRALGAIRELCGSNRLREPDFWADVFIFNLFEGADEPFREPGVSCPGWHKDGYFFRHFLDSPEQALLVLVAWSDVNSRGGATFIAPDSVGVVARFLAEHPEGIEAARMGELIEQCKRFEEVTARAGDVILCHPFMLHAVSQNVLRCERIISNPIAMLREPMSFDRPDGDYSLVEQAILNGLGVSSFDFKRTGQSQSQTPEWVNDAYNRLQTASSISLP